MQKLVLATAVAISTSFTSFAAFAADGSNSGAFVHLGVGKARYNTGLKSLDRDKANTYDLLGGYRWGLGKTFALGVEGGFVQLGSINRVDRSFGTPVKYNLQAWGWLAGANAKWNATRNFSLTGRIGTARLHARADAHSVANPSNRSWSEASNDAAYFGLGAGYAITDHLDLTMQITQYRPDFSASQNHVSRETITTYNAGVEYRF